MQINFFRQSTMNDSDFHRVNNQNLLDRLKITSILLLCIYPYYFYVDFMLLNNVKDIHFKTTLSAIHLTGFMISIIFLVIRRYTRDRVSFCSSRKAVWTINTIIFLYLFMGAYASVNSQRLTGNVDAYLIILLCVAVIFPLKPMHFLPLLAVNHAFFLAGLASFSRDDFNLVTKQINTSATAVFAFFIVFAFQSYRKREFNSRQKLQMNEANFRELFEVNPYPLILTRLKDGRILLINKMALDFYQLSPEQIDQIDSSIAYKNMRDRETLIQELKRSGSIKNYIIEQRVSPGTYKWVMVNYELIDFQNEKCILAGITDITHLKMVEEELSHHASTDMLTGIMNRRYGIDLLQKELDRAEYERVEFIVCFIDINNLKEVNDNYGHAEGDYLISAACQFIKENIGKEDVLFRYGGDELVLVFFHKKMEDVQQIWNRILHAFEEHNRTAGKPFSLSASHGYFHYHSGLKVSLKDILILADADMYKEKHALKA